MKRITSMLTMVMIAMLSFTFVSCEMDDDDIAYNLEGIWEGEIRGSGTAASTTVISVLLPTASIPRKRTTRPSTSRTCSLNSTRSMPDCGP